MPLQRMDNIWTCHMGMTVGMLGALVFFEYLLTVSSWGLSYNLYADKLLGTNVFPQSVYDMRKVILGVRAFPYSWVCVDC